jgi:hypothetical protein
VEASEDGGGRVDDKTADRKHMDELLASIKEKYTQYLSERKHLLQLVSQRPQPTLPSDGESQGSGQAPPTFSAPTTHLLAPYFEGLLSIAHEQKGLIAQKSHLNVTLAKQTKDTCQILAHLAQESQLLSSDPVPCSSRRKLGFGEDVIASEKVELSNRVKPWLAAAESAKIATLEAVTEKIEEGQVALENSLMSLDEIDQILGRKIARQGTDVTDAAGYDVRPARDQPVEKSKRGNPDGSGDVWSMLDGNLGLI